MDSRASTLDTAAAEAYQEYLVPPVFGPWAEYIVGLAAPRAGERVIDFGCGTGVVTRLPAQRAGSAVGVDIDPAMLEVARRLTPSGQYDVEWQCGDACRLECESRTFDLCLCVQGLQHFSGRQRALAGIRRLLKPTGRLVGVVWANIEHTPGLLAVLQALERARIDASAFRCPFALGDAAALQKLAQNVEFASFEARQHEKDARFASVEAFLYALKAGSAASRDALSRVVERVPRKRAGATESLRLPTADSNSHTARTSSLLPDTEQHASSQTNHHAPAPAPNATAYSALHSPQPTNKIPLSSTRCPPRGGALFWVFSTPRLRRSPSPCG